jgi:cell division protein FtsZ
MSKMGMGMMGSGRAIGDERAKEAAEAAIASPLLEDVNLSGARGILVNVTGANMTLGEFQDIGAVVNEFASDDATVVMGTAIDESLDGEIRVTVVATGLGNPGSKSVPAPATASPATAPEIKVVSNTPAEPVAQTSFKEFETPTVKRNQKAVADEAVTPSGEYDEDMLDIPAFLRRQAD